MDRDQVIGWLSEQTPAEFNKTVNEARRVRSEVIRRRLTLEDLSLVRSTLRQRGYEASHVFERAKPIGDGCILVVKVKGGRRFHATTQARGKLEVMCWLESRLSRLVNEKATLDSMARPDCARCKDMLSPPVPGGPAKIVRYPIGVIGLVNRNA